MALGFAHSCPGVPPGSLGVSRPFLLRTVVISAAFLITGFLNERGKQYADLYSEKIPSCEKQVIIEYYSLPSTVLSNEDKDIKK